MSCTSNVLKSALQTVGLDQSSDECKTKSNNAYPYCVRYADGSNSPKSYCSLFQSGNTIVDGAVKAGEKAIKNIQNVINPVAKIVAPVIEPVVKAVAELGGAVEEGLNNVANQGLNIANQIFGGGK